MVELMIVVAIMVILAAAATPVFIGYAQRAKDQKAIAECRDVVQASKVKAGELYAAGLLDIEKDLEIENIEEILKLANRKGKVLDGPFVKTDSQVVFLQYECEDGTVVRYDIRENPEYAVEEGEGPLTRVESWVKKTEDWKKELLEKNPSNPIPGRESIIEEAVKNGGLLEVDKSFTQNTIFEGSTQYWRPYYLDNLKAEQTILFANTSNTGNAQWKATLVYVNGKTYVSEIKGGTGIASMYNNKTYDEVEKWLVENGFNQKN